ncbi:MAG: bifunctional hydroxymethylpyrimidine kinase/phosphomethylpyrimidine kinase [Chloroflexi bacterium]|nr:bifunctional hydroxymethylpyrimidine kinase/phosphomethylpyrimidine kinase [Chloroflexota bacterium]
MAGLASADVERLRALLGSLSGRRVLVIGDLVLDEYLVGRATRLSREAPVPVLELIERFARPGAACNPAANVAALGGVPALIGTLGDDLAGRTLLTHLEQYGIDTHGVVQDPHRCTTVKMRVLAEHSSSQRQQIARVDEVPRGPLTDDLERELARRVEAQIASADVVLVSNYRYGVVTPRLLATVVAAASRYEKPTVVDTQGDLLLFRGFTLVKSNQPDAEKALGVPLDDEDDYQVAGRHLVAELGARSVVITRGADGLSVIEANGGYVHLPPTDRVEVLDVTGAGDTVIAVLALTLATGASVLDGSYLANVAAGLVVQRIGVATVTPAELWAALA